MQRTEMEYMESKGSYNCEMRKMNTEIRVERNKEKSYGVKSYIKEGGGEGTKSEKERKKENE
jgi:hypothetical protein